MATATRGPSEQTSTLFERRLERARRRAGLRLGTLTAGVVDMDDAAGWARLYALGTRAVVEAQGEAIAATWAYLVGTLADQQVPGDRVAVQARSGWLQSGQSVARFIAGTRDAVGARMNTGATFPEALTSSANIVTAVGSSEPHRIGRDATYDSAKNDQRFTRYQRIPEARACPFCLMLASRGAVYLSAASAGTAKKFHANCRCRVEAVVSSEAVRLSKERGAADWADLGWRPPATNGGSSIPPAPVAYDRAADVAHQLTVLRRQVDDGTATAWTRDRIKVLEAEQSSGLRVDRSESVGAARRRLGM